jgi:hypothetical protein
MVYNVNHSTKKKGPKACKRQMLLCLTKTCAYIFMFVERVDLLGEGRRKKSSLYLEGKKEKR